jgi:hypothetical protein
MLFNILIYVLLAFLIIRMIITQKKFNKMKVLNEAVRQLDNEDTFFEKIDSYISSEKEPADQNKGRAVRLYGTVIHERWDEFDETLESLNVASMISLKKDRAVIEPQEVAFFYLYLAIPNLLHAKNRDDLRTKLKEKLEPYAQQLDLQLVKRISDAFDLFYDNKEDRGQAFLESVMNGDYGDYYYSKSLISIYKSLVNAVLAKLYQEQNDTEKYEGCLPMVQELAKTGIGDRWMKGLDLQIEKEEKQIDDDTEKVHDELHPEEKDEESFEFEKKEDSDQNSDQESSEEGEKKE